MQPSSNFCRAQQAHHQALAAGAALENARGVATLAAAVWAREALAAEKREARMARKKLDAAAGVVLHLQLPPPDERAFSENPDRGFADTATVRC